MKFKKFNLLTFLIIVIVLCSNLVFAQSDSSIYFLDPNGNEFEVSVEELNKGITVYFNTESEKADFMSYSPSEHEILRRAIGTMHLGLRYNKNTENGFLYWDVNLPQIKGVRANISCTSAGFMNKKTFYSNRIEDFGYNGVYDRIVGSTDYFHIPYSEKNVTVAFRNAYVYSVTGASSIPSRSSLVSLDN